MKERKTHEPDQRTNRSKIILHSPHKSKSKGHLPSRFISDRKTDKIGYHQIINCNC